MTTQGEGPSRPQFANVSFDGTISSQPPAGPDAFDTTPETVDFGASSAYFGGLDHSPFGLPSQDGRGHPNHGYRYGHDTFSTSPRPVISGSDPISQLGFTSNRASSQLHGMADMHSPPQWSPHNNVHMPTSYHSYPNTSASTHFPASKQYTQLDQGPHQNAYAAQTAFTTQQEQQRQQQDEASQRLAEIERRNRVREEGKARRMLEITKQVNDGMAALQLEKDDAAHRSAEVERRNMQREQDKEKRRLAIQKQVEDGIKAIQREKERERAQVEADRDACRKWLSELHPSACSSKAISPSGSDTVDLYAAIGRQMRGFWEASRPAASSQAIRNEVIADVQRAINAKWPGQGLQVAAFGSSVTGLITETSDLDLVLLDPTRPYGVGTPAELRRDTKGFVRHTSGMPEWYSTNQIGDAIRNSGKFRNIVPISSAAVPIVKMVHRKHGIPADININERFGLFNSQLIQAYANLQPQIVRPLIFLLKHWYSRCELNDPAGKRGSMTFSSYTIALMALQVLQVEGVLPNLQSPDLLNSLNVEPSFLYARTRRPARGKNARPAPVEDASPPKKYNVTFATDHADAELQKGKVINPAADDGSKSVVSSTDPLLGRMLVSFIRFYTQLDRRRHVVSVVSGSLLPRKRGSHPRHVLFDSASEDHSLEPEDGDMQGSPDLLSFASRDGDARAALREEQQDIWAGEELVVQDPFIIDRNTSRNVKAAALERWQSTMRSAADHFGVHLEQNPEHAHRVRAEEAPLLLDLCIPLAIRAEVDTALPAPTGDGGGTAEPWRREEEEAAQAREIAKQAAKKLRQEKKKQARRSKASEARRLQEEAAMVEDMIDGMESRRTTTSAQLSENWRLRPDNGNGTRTGSSHSPAFGSNQGNGAEPSFVPFTFSVERSPGPAPATAPLPPKTTVISEGDKQLAGSGQANGSPTVSTRTDGSSESEDIDLVALRLEQSAKDAHPQ
ncbi:NTP_transf_2 domain-containing protein [Pseudozyma hubeiensis]|nr:NTP_transf_2 domain-containing protein [Pseudozyma hubeiensis]